MQRWLHISGQGLCLSAWTLSLVETHEELTNLKALVLCDAQQPTYLLMHAHAHRPAHTNTQMRTGRDWPWISVSDLLWLTLPHWTHKGVCVLYAFCVLWVLICQYHLVSLFQTYHITEKPVSLHECFPDISRNSVELLVWEIFCCLVCF